jgi:hypothetical protein
MYCEFRDLVGKTFIEVLRDDDSITFRLENGDHYVLKHEQDCCESVYLQDVIGDLDDLVGTEILEAEGVASEDDPPLHEYEKFYTWTFFKIRTIKGSVDIRFYGSSNGYYSESADLYFYEG